jgi:hypothetical protein
LQIIQDYKCFPMDRMMEQEYEHNSMGYQWYAEVGSIQLYGEVFATGRWFTTITLASPTTDHNLQVTNILLKVMLNTSYNQTWPCDHLY